MENVSRLFSALCLAARQGGAVAILFQGRVQNEGKEFEVHVENESDLVRAMRTAKTVVDEAVQEIILLAIAEHMDAREVLIDAEEKTSLLELFPSTTAQMSVIIDPIDGTLDYVNGLDGYSVCIAVIEKARLELAIVFYPARDVAYAVNAEGKSCRYERFGLQGTSLGTEVVLPSQPKRVLYKSRRIPEEFESRFTAAGYEVVGLDAYSDGLLKVVSGEAAGYIANDPQMRDILIGPVIGKAKGGFMCDWRGKEIQWPKRGRISGTFYGNAAFEKEFRELMS
jgi:fructose-1,6-bisphosphatase/inositol monophosphatase family enzyme